MMMVSVVPVLTVVISVPSEVTTGWSHSTVESPSSALIASSNMTAFRAVALSVMLTSGLIIRVSVTPAIVTGLHDKLIN